MLTSPALLSMVSSRSASTRAISTRSAGTVSRPGSTGAELISRLEMESSPAAGSAAVSGNTTGGAAFGDDSVAATPGVDTPIGGAARSGWGQSAPWTTLVWAPAPCATACGATVVGTTGSGGGS